MIWGVGTAAVSVGAGVGDKVSGEAGMLMVGVGWEQVENKTKHAIIKNSGICFFKKMFLFINSLVVA